MKRSVFCLSLLITASFLLAGRGNYNSSHRQPIAHPKSARSKKNIVHTQHKTDAAFMRRQNSNATVAVTPIILAHVIVTQVIKNTPI